jgi:hypothetical protein
LKEISRILREMSKSNDFVVFITTSESKCDECGEDLGKGAWIYLTSDKKALCLPCADMDYLVFLPSGDAALTRRSRKHSRLSAVVVRWSRARKRYERQGLLVEKDALAQAEAECLADKDVRALRRQRSALRRTELDDEFIQKFAHRIKRIFPGCPDGIETVIAEHACLKHSGRIGRTSAAKNFDEPAIRLAVIAHIRHTETPYDELLAKGFDRHWARGEIKDRVSKVLAAWEQK